MKWNIIVRFRLFLLVIFTITLLKPTMILAGELPEGVSVVDTRANGNDDGTTWDDAFNFLKDAIAEANAPGSTTTDIWIAEGMYVPDEDADNPTGTDDRSLSFMPRNGLSLYGAFPTGGGDDTFTARNPHVYITILSADIGTIGFPNDNSYHVVRTADTAVAKTLFNGLVIRDGRGLVTEGIDGQGAGALCVRPAAFVNCTFIKNIAPWGGGGIYADAAANVEIINCIFDGNISPRLNGATAGFGGGILVDATDGLVAVFILNCLFIENVASNRGGGLYGTSGANISITNCTFARNDTAGFGPAIWKLYSLGSIQHCIIWENTGLDGFNLQIDGTCSPVRIRRSSIQGGLDACQIGIDNLFDVDPEFVDPDNFNYRLLASSQLIDPEETDNNLVICDAFDVDDDDITCDENDPELDEPTPDLDFFDRIIDGDEDLTSKVDMGAYEFQTCIWDLNGDCMVNTSDLLELFAQWGTNGPADFNEDGIVNTSDLLILFANWGPCYCDVTGGQPLTFEEELEDACISEEEWEEYEDIMANGTQAEKDNYQCWMLHWIEDCNKCTCVGQSGCPGADPFD